MDVGTFKLDFPGKYTPKHPIPAENVSVCSLHPFYIHVRMAKVPLITALVKHYVIMSGSQTGQVYLRTYPGL